MSQTTDISLQLTEHPRRSCDWPDFQVRLAEILDLIHEDQFLIIQQKQGPRCLQFAGQGRFGLRAEVVSNNFLTGSSQITTEEHEALIRHGWSAPSGSAESATPELDPDGSPNYYIDFPEQTLAAQIADIAVSTLVEGLSIHHPGILHYEAFDGDGNALYFPMLGLKPATEGVPSQTPVEQLVHAMRLATGIGDLEFDDDGNVSISYCDIPIFLSIGDSPPSVRLGALLAKDLPEDGTLLSRVNALNVETTHMHCFIDEGRAIAVASLPLAVMNGPEFSTLLDQFSIQSQSIAIELRALSNGKAFVSGADATSILH